MLKTTIRLALRVMFALAIFYTLVGFCLFVLNWQVPPELVNSPLGKFFGPVSNYSIYATGMPFGALSFILGPGPDLEESPFLGFTYQVGVQLILIPMLSGAMAVWCDAIVKRITTRNAVFFFISFAILCALNSLISFDIMKQLIVIAAFRSTIFDHPIPTHFMAFDLPRIIMISVILGVTLSFFGIWEFIARRGVRRSLLRDTLPQS